MLLAIDVGNTNIVLGVFDGERLVVSWRLLTLRERTADEVGLMVVGLFSNDAIDRRSITGVVMGSVVPPLTPILQGMSRRYFGLDAFIVDPVSNVAGYKFLMFTGEGNGWFKAYDAKTGAVLWKFNCGAGANAAPSVFEVDGEEFIAVAAGGNFQISYPLGNSVFVFGLPKPGM